MATYYMRADGSAANKAAATGPTSDASKCMNVTVHNGETFAAGDTIVVSDAGGVYRATLTPPSSGSSGSPITYEADGSPTIDGSDSIGTWTAFSGGWSTALDASGESWSDITGAPGGRNYRVQIPATALTGSGTSVRLTLRGNSAGSSAIDDVGFGKKAASGNRWDFAASPTPVNVQFSGSDSVTIPAGETVTSDAFVFAFDGTNAYTVSFYHSSSTNEGRIASPSFGAVADYNTSGSDESEDLTPTPYSATQYRYLEKIECYNAATGTTWQATVTTEPNQVFLDGVRLTKGSDQYSLADHEWYWASNVLYLRDETGDPDGSGVTIHASIRDNCFDFNGQDYVSVDGLTFLRANEHCVVFLGDSDELSISNCTLTAPFYAGIDDQSSYAITNVTVSGNTINWCGGHGLIIRKRSHHWTVTNNTVHNYSQLAELGHISAALQYSAGLRAWCDDDSVTDLLFEGNVIYDGAKLPGGSYQDATGIGGIIGVGIWFDTVTTGSVITRNYVRDCLNSGIKLEFSVGHEVSMNLVHGIVVDGVRGASGIWVGAYSNTSAVYDNEVLNNTIYDCQDGIFVSGFSNSDPAGCYDNTFRNNISVGNSSRALKCWFGAENDGTMGSGNVYDHNCFGPESAGFIEWALGTTYSTYDGWLTASSQADNNVESDPLFVNAGGTEWEDYFLRATSPCLDTGVDVGIGYDAQGRETTDRFFMGALLPGAVPSESTGAVTAEVTAGQTVEITVTTEDALGAAMTTGGHTVAVSITGANTATPAVTDEGDGTYTCSYTPTAAGTDSVAITLDGVAISGSPYSSSVVPGITGPANNSLSLLSPLKLLKI